MPQARRLMWVDCDRVGAVLLLHFGAAQHSPQSTALASFAPRYELPDRAVASHGRHESR